MASDEEIEAVLWNDSETAFANPSTKSAEHLLEQYKLYVELADRISQRRGAMNTFFLTFNTAVVGALAAFFGEVPAEAAVGLYVTAVVLSIAWGVLLRSYRNINSAKFRVIGMIEKRLPASPLGAAEWKALGEGKDLSKFIPLSVVESTVPIAFLLVYVYLAVITLRG